MEETLERQQPHVQERVILQEPADGWSRDAYQRELATYVAEHGRAPQTATMHPDTMEALGLSAELGEPHADGDAPLIVASRDYDPATVTFYY